MEPMVNIALRAARKAGNLIARASDDLTRLRFEAKGKADFVTEVDLASEQELITNLQKTYPDHAFICEESGRTGPRTPSLSGLSIHSTAPATLCEAFRTTASVWPVSETASSSMQSSSIL